MNNIVFYSLLIILFFCIIIFIKDNSGESFEHFGTQTEEPVKIEEKQTGSDNPSGISYRYIGVSTNSTPTHSKLNIINKLYKFRHNSELWINSKNYTKYNLKFVFDYIGMDENNQIKRNFTIISGKNHETNPIKDVWSLKLTGNGFVLLLDNGEEKTYKLSWTGNRSFEIMISYKIEDDVHEIVCDIEDELLQSKSEKPLNYTKGHTFIFGSDEFPLEAVNVPLPTLST